MHWLVVCSNWDRCGQDLIADREGAEASWRGTEGIVVAVDLGMRMGYSVAPLIGWAEPLLTRMSLMC